MTEALRTPIIETQHASGVNYGDLSASLNRQPSRANMAAKVALALTIFGGGAKLTADTQSVRGQEPSPAPSLEVSPIPSVTPNPETGLLLCPTPTPEPDETPLPERTLPPDIGVIPQGEVLFAQGQNQNGDTVTVTIQAQEEPSAAPSTGPELSPAPSQNPETAANCNLPKAGEVMNRLISLKKEKIKPVKLKAIERAVWGFDNKDGKHIPGFWDKYSTELEKMYVILWDNTSGFTKKIMREEIEIIGNTSPILDEQNSEAERKLARLTEAGLLTVMFLGVSERSDNPELIQDAQAIGEMVYRYGMVGIHPNFAYSEQAVEDNMLLNGPKLFSYKSPTPAS